MYTIAQIARLLTEDPDVLLEDCEILLEADAQTYLNYFNKSRVQVRQPDGKLVPLRDLGPEARLQIIQAVQAIVEPALARYEQYFVRQVANGFLPLDKIQEDGGRLNDTVAKFLKYSKKAIWEGSKSILDYPDWRELERTVSKFEDDNIEYSEQDDEVLYKKTYVNNVMSLLLGGPPEVYTYWFRSVGTIESACKYGRGTQWCTAKDMGPRHHDRYKYNHFNYYHPESGLYIIELQTPTRPRRPVFQISGYEVKDPEDTSIRKFGPRLIDFVQDVIEHVGKQINANTLEVLQALVRGEELGE